MSEDKRKGEKPVPDDVNNYLNDVQLAELQKNSMFSSIVNMQSIANDFRIERLIQQSVETSDRLKQDDVFHQMIDAYKIKIDT